VAKPGLRKAKATPTEAFWFGFVGPDGHPWQVFLTRRRMRIPDKKDKRDVVGYADSDRREIFVAAGRNDYETIAYHEILHATCFGADLDDDVEERFADLAMSLQVVLASLSFRLPPPPPGFERMRRAARK
jgi:hypothetical protein